MVSMVCARSPISLWHVVFWCMFLSTSCTIYCSNMGVRLRKVTTRGSHTLLLVKLHGISPWYFVAHVIRSTIWWIETKRNVGFPMKKAWTKSICLAWYYHLSMGDSITWVTQLTCVVWDNWKEGKIVQSQGTLLYKVRWRVCGYLGSMLKVVGRVGVNVWEWSRVRVSIWPKVDEKTQRYCPNTSFGVVYLPWIVKLRWHSPLC